MSAYAHVEVEATEHRRPWQPDARRLLRRLRATAEAEIEAGGGFRGPIRPEQHRAHLLLDRLAELEDLAA